MVSEMKQDRLPLSSEKRTGPKKRLSEEQQLIVCGAVLFQEGCVGLRFVKDWILANFGIKVSTDTCSRYMKDHKISLQLFGSHSWPSGTTKENFALGYFDFVKKQRDNGVFLRDPGTVLCIDACSNSVRVDRLHGLAMVGGRQRVFAGKKPVYTNSYVTCVSLDGSGDFKTIMFTHDPCFDPVGPHAKKVQIWCDEMKIARDQIYFVC